MSAKKYDDMTEDQKKTLIQEKYTKSRLSFADIASEYDTYANKIRRDANKFHIKIRDKSEAQSNALKSGKHKHPTKGTQREEDTKNKIGVSLMKSWDSLTTQQLEQRKEKSKAAWEGMDEEQKANIISAANKAVRESSKTGSKLEKFLLKKLLQSGYRVDFHKEQILSNTKLQIDLFLPTMNIAIEVDGPSHFLPVWGEDALEKNKKYDEKKTGLIIGKGLSLIRIKQLKDYSKTRALLVYSNLLSAIEELKNTVGKTLEIEDSV
jgi:very-short-patch-repair endonuclease